MGSVVLFGIILSLVLAALFAGSQVGFVSLNRLAIELKKKQKSRTAQLLSDHLDEPSAFVGSMIVGFTITIACYGMLVDQLLDPLWVSTQALLPNNLIPFLVYIRILFVLVIAAAAFLILFFFSRAVFRPKSDTLMFFLFPVIDFFHSLFSSAAEYVVSLSEWILKNMINVRIKKEGHHFTLLELEEFIQKGGERRGDAHELNKELFEAALTLPYVKIRQCLVPRKEIEAVGIHEPIGVLKEKFITTNLSKLVVYENNIDHIVGYVHQLSLFKNPSTIQSVLLPIPAVPESMTATELLSRLIKERKSMAWVVDEFGGTAGIVTMEDLLEEIFGEIKDEYDTEELTERALGEEEYEFSGRLEMDVLNEKYELGLPMNGSETLSGYIIHHNESIPKKGEKIIVGNYEFEIMEVTGTRIELVRMRKSL